MPPDVERAPDPAAVPTAARIEPAGVGLAGVGLAGVGLARVGLARVGLARWLAAALVTAVLVLAAGACGGGEPASNDPMALGKRVYDQRCATCHGARGQGFVGPPVGGGRMATKYPDLADLRAIVVDGRNQMPPWGNVLSVEEIDAVVTYMLERLGR